MADIFYGKMHEVYGVNSFAEEDYKGYLQHYEFSGDDVFWSNLECAGLIFYDSDTSTTLESFIDMCHKCRPHIIVIEFCHLTNGQTMWEAAEALFDSYARYENLQSYETKLAYGLNFYDMKRK